MSNVSRTTVKYTAPFTTFSKETAEKYADFASFMNLHDDLNKIVWPKRGGL